MPEVDADPVYLTDLVARLDQRFQGREAETSAAEWSRYREERAQLLARLERALATHPRRS